MQSQDVAPRPATIDVTTAEAALVEHYPRLTRLAYLTLPATLGRNRRVLTAHSLVQRALPHGRTPAPPAVIPAQSKGRESDPGYALVRTRVIRTALDAARPLTFRAWPRRAQLSPLLPQVRGLALSPRSGGADENALDQALSALSAPARAAYVLRGLDRLPDDALCEVLAAAGVADPDGALAEAATVPARELLLGSREFDPCTLHARPTDLMRRRRHARAALVAAAAVAVCGALLALPGGGWGPDGAAAPAYARNPSAAAALDPGRLTKAAATAWRTSPRTDFSVWPARGDDVDDTALLRRALAVWARPGESVRVAVTPGTPSGGPAGPPQLLYAGEVDSARVVLLYDGLRIVRYAEPVSGTAGAAVDFARVDGAGRAEAVAVVLGRADGNVRYLTAPWIERAGERDLRKPAAGVMDLHRRADGTVSPLSSPAAHPGSCTSWNVLQLTDRSGGTRLMTDLGELTPAHLTVGPPGGPARGGRGGGAAHLGPVRLLAGGGPRAGCAHGERLAVRAPAAPGRQRRRGVGVHAGGDLAGRGRPGAGPVPGPVLPLRGGDREGAGRPGLRSEGSARPGGRAVEVGRRRVVPAGGRGPRGRHGAGHRLGQGRGRGPHPVAAGEAGRRDRAHGDAGEREHTGPPALRRAFPAPPAHPRAPPARLCGPSTTRRAARS
ncbi:hypothetical protein QFZ63_005537 [Streptomyces sp. B3I7]|nr:hypothetical protein [Streptomyces sp. B3I7]